MDKNQIEINRKKIGKRLKQIRKALNYTQQQFARKLGIPRTNLIRYEKGETIPKADVLSKLFLEIGVNPYYLLKGELPIFITPNISHQYEDSQFEEWINLYFENPNLAKLVLKIAKINKEVKKEVEKLVKVGIPYEKALLYSILEKL